MSRRCGALIIAPLRLRQYTKLQDEEIQRILESENIQMLDAEAKVRTVLVCVLVCDLSNFFSYG